MNNNTKTLKDLATQYKYLMNTDGNTPCSEVDVIEADIILTKMLSMIEAEQFIELGEKPKFISRHDQIVTNPFVTECMRYEVSDPIKYYGKENVLKMLKEYVER